MHDLMDHTNQETKQEILSDYKTDVCETVNEMNERVD